jgi:periplasmic protein TonB
MSYPRHDTSAWPLVAAASLHALLLAALLFSVHENRPVDDSNAIQIEVVTEAPVAPTPEPPSPPAAVPNEPKVAVEEPAATAAPPLDVPPPPELYEPRSALAMPPRPAPHRTPQRIRESAAAKEPIAVQTGTRPATTQLTPTPAPAASGTAVDPTWQARISAWLQAHKSYPEAAREQGTEGVASVLFTVARDGRVLTVSLVRGSGSAVLDAATLTMLRDAHVPAFLAAMPQAEVTVTVRVHYDLQH